MREREREMETYTEYVIVNEKSEALQQAVDTFHVERGLERGQEKINISRQVSKHCNIGE